MKFNDFQFILIDSNWATYVELNVERDTSFIHIIYKRVPPNRVGTSSKELFRHPPPHFTIDMIFRLRKTPNTNLFDEYCQALILVRFGEVNKTCSLVSDGQRGHYHVCFTVKYFADHSIPSLLCAVDLGK